MHRPGNRLKSNQAEPPVGCLRREFLKICARRGWLVFSGIGMLAAGLPGCRLWEEEPVAPATGLRLGGMRSSPDGMAVLVAVVTLRAEQREQVEPLWSQWDSQAIGLLQRRVWDENGLRIAVAPNQLPGPLLRVLETEEETVAAGLPRRISAESPLASDGDRSAWRLTLRDGQPKLIGLTPVYPEASWTVRAEGGLSAGAGEQVSGLMQLMAFAAGDGTVRLTLRPLLRHGKPLTRVGVIDSSLAFQTAQTEALLEELRVDVRLRSGQTLVAGLGPVSAELGEVLFGTPGVDGLERLLLIRLVHSPGDFRPSS